MKKIWISLIAAGLLTIAAFAPVAGQDSVTLEFEPVDDSGVGGNVLLTATDGQTDVEVLITEGLEDGAVHPVHIHQGTCDDLGDVVHPLDNIEGGVSETTIDVELMDLLDGDHAVNVHLSEEEIDVRVACADIPEGGVGGPGEDDETAEDDEAVEDDAADENGDEETDDAAEDDEESVVPAAGSVGGPSGDTIALMVALMGGSALGFGVLIRRQASRTRIS